MPVFALKGVTPVLGRGVFVAPTASVIGDVVLGHEASVWFGAVVRGDAFPIRIGARTNIQDNAVLHVTGGKASTTLGDDVTVGHGAIVHGCTIGDRCLVGMGCIVLDGAVVEHDCLIGAGALVPPRMRVPAGSLVLGSPAKIQRSLRLDELATVLEAAAHYVQYGRDYLAGLTPA